MEIKNFVHFNLFDVFNEFYHKKYDSLNKILAELNLKQNNSSPPCPKELKTMARIVNKIIKNGKLFYMPEKKDEIFVTNSNIEINKKSIININDTFKNEAEKKADEFLKEGLGDDSDYNEIKQMQKTIQKKKWKKFLNY